ncbi:hypothetical protein HD553DRAFT_359091 [Filobasidium floriforme]|uniref:uncharacterized protein n=1 Tax=Filobasidium floriforme TaxID=5210 RepID=UPI001E8E60FB|nr:uncharacterized protein HD553DRAFT_359091 [Filobasidium floriforme]KAH8081951.1 hypothetical protein HD553DRAFT_359091 [Filobasidium floriforme]
MPASSPHLVPHLELPLRRRQLLQPELPPALIIPHCTLGMQNWLLPRSVFPRSTCSSCPPWPISRSVISHLAMNAGLDELSNHPEAGSIADHLESRNDRKSSRGPNPRVTDKSTAFAYYQTGTHGPQFGYRLVLVEEGNDVDFVSEQVNARGPISGDTAEMLVFPLNSMKDGLGEMIVLPERGDRPQASGSRSNDDGDADDTDKRTIEYVLNSSLLDNDIHIDLPTFQPGTIAKKLQERCRTQQTSLLTLGSYMQKITYSGVSTSGENASRRILIIIRSRNSLEEVEDDILSWINGRASGSVEQGSGVCLIFEERGAGMVVFR